MSQAPALVKGEDPRRTKVSREFKGVFTRSSRSSMPEDHFYNLENIIPIGDANLRTVPDKSAVLIDYGADSIYWSQYANVATVDYLLNFSTNGKVFAYQIVAATSAQINALHLLSGSNSRMAQWKNTHALFIDSTGYYSWDGTTFSAAITGVGVPSSGTDIAVYAGRVWIVQGRLLTWSAADDFSAAGFLVANGGGSLSLTDPTLRNAVTRLWAQNGYLYIIGPSSINVISDVYVPTGASPPTPVFTNLNVQAVIGTDQPAGFTAYNRALMFASRYGVYALSGVDAQRLSEDIDGTWQFIDFTQTISAGAVLVKNILCAAFLIKRASDPVFGSNTVIAMWFDNKWWFANFGALTFIVTGIKTNAPALYGFIANQLYQLFSNTASGPAFQAMTPLWGMDDPLSDKQVIRAGFEVTATATGGMLTLTVDTVNASYSTVSINLPGNFAWFTGSGTPFVWINNALAVFNWTGSAYTLYDGASPYAAGKYVGVTVNGAAGNVLELSSFLLDYKLRARW